MTSLKVMDAKDWSEADYRKQIALAFTEVADQFEEVDPDTAECEQAFGVLTIIFSDRTKVILSAQPSVRQLWVAMAAQGTACHFVFDHESAQWVDVKGKEGDLKALLSRVIFEKSGVRLWPSR
ncbi:MAG: iron donor protein CyaY [Pseudomonadota bacterium]|jgi:iron donor protein CyaY